jgi:nitrite reductase (NO-forming)
VETTPSAGSRPPGRLRRYARYQLLVAAWLTAAGVAGAAGSVLPHARWVVVHLLLLGAVSSAVMIWSTHFATTLLRAPDPPGSNGFRARLGGLNAGALVVVLGVAGDRGPVVALGAVLVGASAAAHAGALVAAARRALPSRFVLVVRYYVAAALLLPVGAWLGYLLTRPGIGDDLTARLRLAHEAVNLLGWIGLTVAGTLVTFWPTVLRTRLPDGSQRAARRALPLLLLGIGLIAAPAAAGLRPPVALTGVGGYDAGLILLAGPWVAALRQRPPRSMAAWSLLAGTGWWLLTLAGLAGAGPHRRRAAHRPDHRRPPRPRHGRAGAGPERRAGRGRAAPAVPGPARRCRRSAGHPGHRGRADRPGRAGRTAVAP